MLHEYYEIYDATCIKQTKQAICIEAEDFDEPQWIPQSCILDESEVYQLNDSGTCIIQEWFAKQKGWL